MQGLHIHECLALLRDFGQGTANSDAPVWDTVQLLEASLTFPWVLLPTVREVTGKDNMFYIE